MSADTTGHEPDYYLSSDRLRHMVLDFIQMHDFMQEPLVFDRGEGIWVWDARGDQYLDSISGVWVTCLGTATVASPRPSPISWEGWSSVPRS